MRKRLSLKLGSATVMLVTATAVPSSAAVRPGHGHGEANGTCSAGASLLGFSDGLDKTTFEGTAVAGLSALSLTSPSRGLALVDNIGTTPARVYDVSLKVGGQGLAATVRGVTTLRRPDGTAYTGADFDGEGLVAERDERTVLASSETEPTIRRFRLSDGRQVAELPVPSRLRVAPAGEATRNQTFEALAATPDGRTLYAGMEGPLSADGSDGQGHGLVRVLRYAGRSGGAYAPAAQYAYRTDPALGLVELLALGRGRLIALERGFTAGVGNTVRVYLVSAAGAPDVTGTGSLAALSPRAFLSKKLLVDLASCPPSGATAKQPQPNPLLDNVEGMALGRRVAGGRHVLYLVSDDNAGATQTTRVYALSALLDPWPDHR